MRYPCTNCPAVFYDWPAASNHELATDYKHLTFTDYSLEQAEQLVACSECQAILHAADAIWSGDGEDPYCSMEHEAEARMVRAMGFYSGVRL
jgi:hypothetical protein